MLFHNRQEAGQRLAAALSHYEDRQDLLVLALPRGGVPVAVEVANSLHAPLDLMLVRKLGVPGHEELAMGALATGGSIVLNKELIGALGITQQGVDRVMVDERKELQRREQAYRGDRPLPEMAARCVILVDDGIATGASMRAAVKALRQHGPNRIVVAVPVAPPDTVEVVGIDADEVVALEQPSPFYGVGYWYHDFSQTTDDEVREHLLQAWSRPQMRPPAQQQGRQPNG